MHSSCFYAAKRLRRGLQQGVRDDLLRHVENTNYIIPAHSQQVPKFRYKKGELAITTFNLG